MIQAEYRDISTLRKLEGNPRIIKDKQFKTLCESIKANGDYFEARPCILSDRTGVLVIIAGNQRYEAARHLGMKSIPTVLLPNLTEEREREIVIRDNVANGEWDFDLLANEWDADDLLNWGVEIPELDVEPEELEAKEDNYQIPDEIKTDIVYGDLIEIGEHRLLCGSSLEADSWGNVTNKKEIDLLVTDPPYNVDYTGGTKSAMKIENDNMSDGDFYQFLYDAFVAAALFLKKGGGVYVWHADSEELNFRKALIDSGILFKQNLVWVKNSMVLGRQDYQWKHEPCLYGWKPGAAHYFTPDRTNTTVVEDQADYKKMSKAELVKIVKDLTSDKTKSTVIHCDKPTRSAEHPTMKPILLLAPLIGNSSIQGEVVADGFLGSGSTMVAAHQLKRKCYGIELSEKYCQVIVDRMRKLDPTLTVKRNGELWEA